MKKAIELDSGFIDAWTDLINVECFVFQGEAPNSLRAGKIKKYYAYFNSHFPDGWQKKLVQGQFTYRVLEELKPALNLLLEVLGENPDNIHATYAVSTLYRRRLDFKKAIEFAVKLINLDPARGGNWVHLGGILDLMGDSKNSFKARLKGWNLSHSKGFGSQAMIHAILANVSLEELPADLKKEFGLELEFWKAAMKRDWVEAKTICHRNKDYNLLSSSCWQLGEKDSARYYWIKKGLADKSDSSFYYTMMGDRKKALPSLVPNAKPKNPENVLSFFEKQTTEIQLLIELNEYKEATEKLINLNNILPEVDDYSWYRNMPWYDKIKKEYPPFLEVINNPKRQPVLDINDFIKL